MIIFGYILTSRKSFFMCFNNIIMKLYMKQQFVASYA